MSLNGHAVTNGNVEQAVLRQQVTEIVDATPVVDIHTHLFAPEFGDLGLSGIDELLTYHYLIAELFRFDAITPEQFWVLSKTAQADLIWRVLFVENTPLSEAARGVITVLTALGLPTDAPDLREIRAYFRQQSEAEHLERVFKLAGVSEAVMTNDPFNPRENNVRAARRAINPRFRASLRLDTLLNDWPRAAKWLDENGYGVSVPDVRRFLDDAIASMNPLYLAVSLPDSFRFPDQDERQRLLTEAVLPTALAHNLPMALMIGVRRGVNPRLCVAGDGVGRADVSALARLCAEYPDVKFLATLLASENQTELCVTARKFSNLMPFGCWWFLNTPSHIAAITTERLELLGTSFIPQHSDARILEQLIYKWRHARQAIAASLTLNYTRLQESGRRVSRQDIQRDVAKLFAGNFYRFCGEAARTHTA